MNGKITRSRETRLGRTAIDDVCVDHLLTSRQRFVLVYPVRLEPVVVWYEGECRGTRDHVAYSPEMMRGVKISNSEETKATGHTV